MALAGSGCEAVSLVAVALAGVQRSPGGEPALQIDRFGLSLGAVSVGLPMSCTTDDVLRRYLDLLQLVRGDTGPGRGVVIVLDPPAGDLEVLAASTRTDEAFVARRLAVLQGRRLG